LCCALLCRVITFRVIVLVAVVLCLVFVVVAGDNVSVAACSFLLLMLE
jgi:hypothetical protein